MTTCKESKTSYGMKTFIGLRMHWTITSQMSTRTIIQCLRPADNTWESTLGHPCKDWK